MKAIRNVLLTGIAGDRRLWPRPQIILVVDGRKFFVFVEIPDRMTIYKPKPGEKKVEKKCDSSNSTIRIPEDVVWTRFCVISIVDQFQL